jgi:hypothetical protein
VPDGNDVDVVDGVIVAGGRAATPDALANAEATWQQVVARDLSAKIMVVDDGKYIVYSGPFDTGQQAQATCALSALAQRCVPAQSSRTTVPQTPGLRAV